MLLYPQQYTACQRYRWLDDVCSHLEPKAGAIERCVYIYELRNKTAYVGLTYNLATRHSSHKGANTPLGQAIRAGHYNLICDENYMPLAEAAELEKAIIKDLRANGFMVLNKKPGGQLGSRPSKWNEKSIAVEALKYTTRSDFAKNASAAYYRAKALGIFEQVVAHMTPTSLLLSEAGRRRWRVGSKAKGTRRGIRKHR